MPSRYVPALLFLFVGSGCAALVYEVVWFQLLQLIIGSSAISLAVLLGVYMGGMCLGSLLLPKVVAPRRHPLVVFGLIECGIGLCGLLVLHGVPVLALFYPSIATGGSVGVAVRTLICAACLLPPTLLMGASLPAIGRYMKQTPRDVSALGLLYGGNIFGAVLGALIAGFHLLRFHDMAFATYAAVALNFGVGLIAFAVSRVAPFRAAPADAVGATTGSVANFVLLVIAISGATALGAEVVWTRLLSTMLGATVYTFSIVLAVFLAGLGIGSSAMAAFGRRIGNPAVALGVTQLLLTCALAWAAYALTNLVPSADFLPSYLASAREIFVEDIRRTAWVVLPSAILWGASFPIVLQVYAGRNADTGAMVGRVYAANTLGGIVGAVLISIVMIPALGTANTERALILLAGAGAALAFGGALRGGKAVAASGASLLVALAANATVEPVPWRALAYGRLMNTPVAVGTPLYIGEGLNSTIAISAAGNGIRDFHVSGKVEASNRPTDMRLQRMLGHLAALLATKHEDILVVGFGAGVTAGSFVKYPDVRRIDVAELEPLVPTASDRYFGAENYGVLRDPRVEMHYDDGRHFIQNSQRKYDVITSDPIHPWVKGMATLYTREYFEICKRHLKTGGVVTLWVPLYDNDFQTIGSELATFFEVFPNATIWSSDASGRGYDLVAIGQAEPGPIDVDAIEERLRRPDHYGVVESLAEVGLGSASELIATYAGREGDLHPLVRGAAINTDLNLRLQYLAGWSLNFNRADLIYSALAARRTPPTDLFVGNGQLAAMLRAGGPGPGTRREPAQK